MTWRTHDGTRGKWKGTHVDCWRNELDGKYARQLKERTEKRRTRGISVTSPGTHREVIGNHRELIGNSPGVHRELTGYTLETHRELTGNPTGFYPAVKHVDRVAKRTGNTRRRHWKCQVNIQENGWVKALETNRATVERTEREPTANTRGSRRDPAGNLWERMGSARALHT